MSGRGTGEDYFQIAGQKKLKFHYL